jgi:molybdopterin converting factor subunit 1
MRVNVKLFAVVRERVGVSELPLEVPPGTTAGDALGRLRESYGEIASMLSRCAVAVNRQYVNRDAVLHDGDELAVIPPVSGG